ncbi:hypothetical protein J2Y48_004547 [Mycoplana sp. BE70]|uniref:hypothetical protein n=1 Tax=Mycoplana sp. BE70 TaxID=2817775 RepID=UPI00285AA261|nr:hypothetical protein [Mycoplana sp. BE70]MDR6759231.1 hypothetical protein [Mycoplana sp. BE70]
MFFTKVASVVAWLALIGGALQLFLGYGIATEAFGPYDLALKRYAPGATGSGKIIDRGFYTVIFAIAFGTLAEISRSVQRAGRSPSQE